MLVGQALIAAGIRKKKVSKLSASAEVNFWNIDFAVSLVYFEVSINFLWSLSFIFELSLASIITMNMSEMNLR